jgi:benzoyl-CoA reductase/2-hydroxyglutaryl-CoA dehydratase subunit BcrC/BadD/HgdB
MPQTEITREQIIVVDHSEIDQYGKLIVTDKSGVKHTINAKHSHLAEFIIPGRAVKFMYATYMNKEYIADAVLVELPANQQQPPPQAPESVRKPVEPQKNTIVGAQVGMTVKELGDMIRAKMLTIVFGEETAKELTRWYKNQITTTAGIESALVKAAKAHGAVEVNEES